MVLKSSETAIVRKAVMAAGASLVIVTPVSRHNGAINLDGWYCDGTGSGADRPVRLEIIADVAKSNNIVSAFLANARAGGIENIISFPAGKPPKATLRESRREEANV